jgi:solute carrier family 40 (iron-regulated transporter), member 1
MPRATSYSSFSRSPDEHASAPLTASPAASLSSSSSSSPLSLTDVNRARRLLYVSHFFNQFSENTWQFCLVLFLAAFSNYQSLILVTSYGLVSFSFVCIFGSTAGRFVDGTNRLQVARQFIGFENLSVLLATLMCYLLLSRDNFGVLHSDGTPPYLDGGEDTTSGTRWRRALFSTKDLTGIPTDPLSVFLLVGIHLLGAVASILDSGFLVAVERDWIVVMSEAVDHGLSPGCSQKNSNEGERLEKQRQWLSDTNVFMRQIDLGCKIGAPAVAGVFVGLFDDGSQQNHGYDLRGAAILVGMINVAALLVEYICTSKIYHDVPDLALKSEPRSLMEKHEDGTTIEAQQTEQKICKLGNSTFEAAPRRFFQAPEGLLVYFSQPVCWAGFSLALLYLNVVLTFGGVMTAYLVWRGMGLEAIGLWRGVSSAAGLAGTFVYHFMAKKLGLVEVGMMSVLFQLLCLSSCYVSLFVVDRTTSFAMLICGVCLSRIGLWVFDISVTQLMQENIPAPVRGLVGGVQKSLNAFFTIVAYGVGLFVSDPENFYIYASSAYAGVALAAVFYALRVFTKRFDLDVPKKKRKESLGVNEDTSLL